MTLDWDSSAAADSLRQGMNETAVEASVERLAYVVARSPWLLLLPALTQVAAVLVQGVDVVLVMLYRPLHCVPKVVVQKLVAA